MQKLVDWGCIEVESKQDARGGYINLHHTLPLEAWEVLRTIDDIRNSGLRKCGDLINTSFPDSVPDSKTAPKSQNKTEKPCHNDDADLIQASISPMSLGKKSASSLGKRVPSARKYAMQYAKSMEFLYSKDRKGGYDWEITNPAAEKFIRDHGKEAAQVLLNWAQEQAELHGRVKVRPDMFDFVWARFEEDQHTWSIDV
jgi:hypothetical protein